jgi:TolA-binding protein
MIIVIGLLAGCASVFRDLDDTVNRKRFKSDYASFENALSIYKDGDYKQAMNLFGMLSTARTHENLARKAWLGEICCRLMLADTQADYTVAIGLWHDFGKSAPENDDAWELTLLDPVIVRMTPKSTTRVIKIYPPATKTSAETAAPADPQQSDQPSQTDRAALQKKAAQVAQLQRQLDAVTDENRSLKEKIKALETIDQNIQKKKTEMVAPSE